MATEVRFLGALSLYGLATGAIYWFLSYEAAGTVLLVGFGLATGAGFLVLGLSARGRRAAVGAHPTPDGPFGDESGAIPTRSVAPLAVGAGLAVAALGLVFGIWFTIVGILPIALGGADWLRAARRELDQVERKRRR